MKIVALLSGGKDSCYNLVHCAANGHALVAAASLGPGPGMEEIDSYMYQTVGQDAIDLVAQALDVPLYRHVIKGSAVEQGSEYGSRDGAGSSTVAGDETEDLYELLKTVITAHPEITGVSVGAILSNYQRVRVEHVCRRLSLTCLCYLWQRDQTELLGEMIENGLEAILIKVAGAGLTEKHLGKTLAEMQPTLHKLRDLYQTHVCGEGGEYETLTLNCPVFKRRINIQKTEIVTVEASDVAPVAYLRIQEASLGEANPQLASYSPDAPPLLEDAYAAVEDVVGQVEATDDASLDSNAHEDPDLATNVVTRGAAGASGSTGQSDWTSISNISINYDVPPTIEEECADCWETAQRKLAGVGLDITRIAHVNVYLASMEYFPAINAAMYRLFGTSPPTRACVAVDLPPTQRVRLDVIAYNKADHYFRHSLHVQSMSYWAPANIGPYSQSITVNRRRMFVSGQIGLVPSSMTFPSPPSLARETALAFQHADRVAAATMDTLGLSSRYRPYTELSILWTTDPKAVSGVCRAWSKLREKDHFRCPTAIIVGAKELPRNAQVEAQLIYRTEFLEDEDAPHIVLFNHENVWVSNRLPAVGLEEDVWMKFERLSRPEEEGPVAWLALRGPNVVERVKELPRISETLYIRAFYTHKAQEGLVETLSTAIFGSAAPITPVPARFLATSDGEHWDCIFCLW